MSAEDKKNEEKNILLESSKDAPNQKRDSSTEGKKKEDKDILLASSKDAPNQKSDTSTEGKKKEDKDILQASSKDALKQKSDTSTEGKKKEDKDILLASSKDAPNQKSDTSTEGKKKEDKDILQASSKDALKQKSDFLTEEKKTEDYTIGITSSEGVPKRIEGSSTEEKIGKLNDNFSTVFKPIITVKHNASKPLVFILEGHGVEKEYRHPYKFELDNLTVPLNLYSPTSVQPFLSENDTTLKMVETKDDLEDLISLLQNEKEVAVDVEFHKYRTFQEYCCLLQISTRRSDFIVDILKLENIQELNLIFSDPNILKVFHGADNDVIKLHKDCGIYVVGLFDTCIAAIKLGYADVALGDLVMKFCKIRLTLKGESFDWRTRELTGKMIKYAQSDTHYLLNVFDCLKIEMLGKGEAEGRELISDTFNSSRDLCLKRYKIPLFKVEKHVKLIGRNIELGKKERECVKELFTWRDTIARTQDESLQYILTNAALIKLSQELPCDETQIRNILNELSKTSINIPSTVSEILEITKKSSKDIVQAGTEETVHEDIVEIVHEDIGETVHEDIVETVQEESEEENPKKRKLEDDKENSSCRIM